MDHQSPAVCIQRAHRPACLQRRIEASRKKAQKAQNLSLNCFVLFFTSTTRVHNVRSITARDFSQLFTHRRDTKRVSQLSDPVGRVALPLRKKTFLIVWGSRLRPAPSGFGPE